MSILSILKQTTFMSIEKCRYRHCERSEAISHEINIASSYLLAMTRYNKSITTLR